MGQTHSGACGLASTMLHYSKSEIYPQKAILAPIITTTATRMHTGHRFSTWGSFNWR